MIMNAKSEKMGKKDILKVECDIEEMDMDVLAVIDHNITVNVIKDGEIVAALVDGESTLKIYHPSDGAGVPYLQAANEKDSMLYPDIYAHNSLYIQGVAVFVIKQVGTLTAG